MATASVVLTPLNEETAEDVFDISVIYLWSSLDLWPAAKTNSSVGSLP